MSQIVLQITWVNPFRTNSIVLFCFVTPSSKPEMTSTIVQPPVSSTAPVFVNFPPDSIPLNSGQAKPPNTIIHFPMQQQPEIKTSQATTVFQHTPITIQSLTISQKLSVTVPCAGPKPSTDRMTLPQDLQAHTTILLLYSFKFECPN